MIGIPLPAGFHVLEIASQRLGQSLLNDKYGPQRSMVVRTSALVTNLGVHFKLGRDNSVAWVTTLDTGKPVAGATVQVSDCHGKPVASASTDARGIASFKGISPEAPRCGGGDDENFYADFRNAYFVSARADNQGAQDMAFTWSSWQRGIEPWRFNVPTSNDPRPDQRAHTVFDRVLLRAGETVSMKHLLRTETAAGFGLPPSGPATLVITHVGSGQEFTQPVQWRNTATGGRSAESTFAIPPAAKLGVYQVALRVPARAGEGVSGEQMLETGQFRVEEFRLPVLKGSVAPQSKDPLIAAASVPVQVQIGYVAGGPAANLPVRVSALTRNKSLRFNGYDEFSFEPPRPRAEGPQTGEDGEEESTARQDQRVVADKLPVTLDRQGQGSVTIDQLKPSAGARELVVEANFADPNGEIQTLRGTGRTSGPKRTGSQTRALSRSRHWPSTL